MSEALTEDTYMYPRREEKPVGPHLHAVPNTDETEVYLIGELPDEEEVTTPDLVRLYMNGFEDLLTAAEEVELAKRYEVGLFAAEKLRIGRGLWALSPQRERDLTELANKGLEARQVLIESNLRLVVSIASRYKNVVSHLKQLDLIQEGNLGLIRAVEKFDYTKGYKFSSYATWWIKKFVHKAMAELDRTIHLPLAKAEMVQKLGKTTRVLTDTLGREPTKQELQDEMDISADELEDLQQLDIYETSLNKIVRDGDDEFEAFVADRTTPSVEEQAINSSLRWALEARLEKLTPEEAEVIRLSFGLGHDRQWEQTHIAQKLHISTNRVVRVKAKALEKLRRPEELEKLADYA